MDVRCIADTHLTPLQLESLSLFPRHLNRLPEDRAKHLYSGIRDDIHDAWTETRTALARDGKPDLLVHLGDMTGGWRERGCSHPETFTLTRGVHAAVQVLAKRNRFCFGNHDTGYPGGIDGSNLTRESIEALLDIFGYLYWVDDTDVLSIGLCSPLASYQGDDPVIHKLLADQQDFVGDQLASNRGTPFVLYAHDPHTPAQFARELGPHLKSLIGFVFADFHSPLLGRAFLTAARAARLFRWDSVTLKCLRRGILCPSVAPLWWPGRAYLRMIATPTRVHARRVQLYRPNPGIPTASFVRCAKWMFR